ncbi:hypothetical protein DFH09DRAFT_1083210 [Mycena vulgaris]|nr:hypothetical protein DFH09DRAFT_1083210 [Mycena vulgaris]
MLAGGACAVPSLSCSTDFLRRHWRAQTQPRRCKRDQREAGHLARGSNAACPGHGSLNSGGASSTSFPCANSRFKRETGGWRHERSRGGARKQREAGKLAQRQTQRAQDVTEAGRAGSAGRGGGIAGRRRTRRVVDVALPRERAGSSGAGLVAETRGVTEAGRAALAGRGGGIAGVERGMSSMSLCRGNGRALAVWGWSLKRECGGMRGLERSRSGVRGIRGGRGSSGGVKRCVPGRTYQPSPRRAPPNRSPTIPGSITDIAASTAPRIAGCSERSSLTASRARARLARRLGRCMRMTNAYSPTCQRAKDPKQPRRKEAW